MKKVVLAIWRWIGSAAGWRLGTSSLPWRRAASRYRCWFKAELSGSLKNKRARDQAVYALHLAGRCLFCGEPFWQGERVTWLPAHRRGYCDSCRDELEAAERHEEEAEANVDVYARRGVARKDFYR